MKIAVLAGIALALACGTAAADDQAVDLELVLEVDASASIREDTLSFQLNGHAAAFEDTRVRDAIALGPVGGIAVTVVRFDSPRTLAVLVPWTMVASAEEAQRFADAIRAAPRGSGGGTTAIGNAVADALPLFRDNGFDGGRLTIDIVSNGFSNAGIEPAEARRRAEAAGVTVNALAILDEYPWLEGYYREQVVTRPGAFVRTAKDLDSFVEALVAKLVTEIVQAPLPSEARFAAASLR